MSRKLGLIAIVFSVGLASARLDGAAMNAYFQTNLVSDLPGVANNLDTNLANPWGIAFSPSSPFWISDNHTGLSTLYTGTGQPLGLVVTIPTPVGGTPPAAPTGVVFNAGTDFAGSHFIFATEDGTVSAWTSGTNAILKVDNSASGAVYKGLAIGNNGSGNFLYATNFNAGSVDVFNGSFSPVSTVGGFKDPSIPAGFAPFNIENIGGQLYVTYAKQNAAKHDDVAGPGSGYIDVFDLNGNLVRRLVSNGPLNSPWGLALATSSFGAFSNDLLVGNFGDGTIQAFDPITGAALGQLKDANGNPIVNQGLWGLAFGNNAVGVDKNSLYFTAGIPGNDNVEDHGLFGQLQVVPEPGTLGLMGLGILAIGVARKGR